MANQNQPVNLGHLQVIASQLVKRGISKNTRNSYDTALQKLGTFRLKYCLQDIWPIPVQDLLNFIAYLSSENLSPSTVTSYLSGISYFHKINGFNDTTKHFIISKALEGFKRNRGPQIDQRDAISIPILTKLITHAPKYCTSIYEATLFSAAFSLAFFALLRVSEFTKNNSKDATEVSKQIQFSNVLISKGTIQLQILHSKTQQRGKPVKIAINENREVYCPLLNMKKYLKVRPKCKNGDLFIHMNHKSLTTYQFNAVLKKALCFLHLDNSQIRSHSFRIGGTTYLKTNNVSDEKIMQLGRWKSNAYQRYIR